MSIKRQQPTLRISQPAVLTADKPTHERYLYLGDWIDYFNANGDIQANLELLANLLEEGVDKIKCMTTSAGKEETFTPSEVRAAYSTWLSHFTRVMFLMAHSNFTMAFVVSMAKNEKLSLKYWAEDDYETKMASMLKCLTEVMVPPYIGLLLHRGAKVTKAPFLTENEGYLFIAQVYEEFPVQDGDVCEYSQTVLAGALRLQYKDVGVNPIGISNDDLKSIIATFLTPEQRIPHEDLLNREEHRLCDQSS